MKINKRLAEKLFQSYLMSYAELSDDKRKIREKTFEKLEGNNIVEKLAFLALVNSAQFEKVREKIKTK